MPLFLAGALAGQDAQMNERAAKEAVGLIVRHSGLLPSFTVIESARVRTASAYIKGRKRVIAYNPSFIASIMDSTCTDWVAVSILAHEIGHHLLGHTLAPQALRPGDELACDHYSGFILHAMGASLQETVAAMDVAGNPHGTRRHPPKHARLEAIRQGWEQADAIARGGVREPFLVKEAFRFVVRFTGDPNTYYVDSSSRLVWFNERAEPIEFGFLTRLATGEFQYKLTWGEQVFHIDGHNTIWNQTAHRMRMKVGRLERYLSD